MYRVVSQRVNVGNELRQAGYSPKHEKQTASFHAIDGLVKISVTSVVLSLLITLSGCGSIDSAELNGIERKVEERSIARALDPAVNVGRAAIDHKGSLLIYPHVELKWDAIGTLRQDTFLTLNNDHPSDVQVQLFFVNGDAPLQAQFAGEPPVMIERPHPGWNRIDNQAPFTGNESIYWSANTGQPKGLSSFTILDPGIPPGRPDTDPDNPGGRVIRGFVLAWAVNNAGEEVSWNHLSGGATIIDYREGSTWEYASWAYQANNVLQGLQPISCLQTNLDTGRCIDEEITAGHLDLDGFEYNASPGRLQFQFRASGEAQLGVDGLVDLRSDIDSILTLMSVDVDLRQDHESPVTTKAKFDIWNQNEVRFSGTEKCITCWDSELLSQYTALGIPNHFLKHNLQTEFGHARVDGMASTVCTGISGASRDAAILGVLHKVFYFNSTLSESIEAETEYSMPTGPMVDRSGLELGGQAYETARILYDIIEPPGTAESGNSN